MPAGARIHASTHHCSLVCRWLQNPLPNCTGAAVYENDIFEVGAATARVPASARRPRCCVVARQHPRPARQRLRARGVPHEAPFSRGWSTSLALCAAPLTPPVSRQDYPNQPPDVMLCTLLPHPNVFGDYRHPEREPWVRGLWMCDAERPDSDRGPLRAGLPRLPPPSRRAR